MSPTEPINERVATLETKVENLKEDSLEFRTFKEAMIKEIAALTATVKALTWKVGLITGTVVVVFSQLIQWGITKLLP